MLSCVKRLYLGLAMTLTLAVSLSAAPLLEEHFADDTTPGGGGTFQTPSNWAKSGGAFVYSLGDTGYGAAGDFAVFLSGPSFAYTDGIRSTQSFTRGANLRCTFKMFVHQGPLGVYYGVGGPWVNRGSYSGTFPSLEQIEAGFSRYSGSALYYVEGTSTFDTVAVSNAFVTALSGAVNKATALTCRVTLGNSTGAKVEWSTDGVTFNVLQTIGGSNLDTTGQTAGTNYNGSNLVSSASQVWVYFGGAASTTPMAVIDDILVEDDNNNTLPVELSSFSME